MSADFEVLRVEAAAAKVARDEAEERYRAASDALRKAQCRAHYDTTPSSRIGYQTMHFCTLQKNHDGNHGKAEA